MIPLPLSEIIHTTKSALLSASHPVHPAPACRSGVRITDISTDSRTVKAGSLFIAIKGNNLDGHDFIADVIKKKATAIILSKIPKNLPRQHQTTLLKVTDTVKAYGDIARYYRSRLKAKVIVVGGSNGKTTTKEMIAHILGKQYSVVKSPKSFNNFIGVPYTILLADHNTDFLVVEIGTNHPGEISYLAEIAKPDIAVITNISEEHLEGLKSLKGVLKEEACLFKYLRKNNTAIFDASTNSLKRLTKSADYNIVTFGLSIGAEYTGQAVKVKTGSIEFVIKARNRNYSCSLPVLGSWNARNALTAFAATNHAGINPKKICSALADFKLPGMRMEKHLVNGVTFINDAYNANPISVNLLLNDFSSMPARMTNANRSGGATPKRKVFIFGEMGELGASSQKYHREAAKHIARSRIDICIMVGQATRWTALALRDFRQHKILSFYYDNVQEFIKSSNKIISQGDTVLLKGSRTNSLEKIIQCYSI